MAHDVHMRRLVAISASLAALLTADGNAIFARRSIARLYKHYGTRVRRAHDDTGDRWYFIKSRYHHRPVETQFHVDRFSRKKARVLDVFILFTDKGP